MSMRVLVIGGGGREHALCWGIRQSPACEYLFCAPGNPGIATIATCIQLVVEDHSSVVSFCLEQKINLVVVGPEAPLVDGLVDTLQSYQIPVFGPTKAAARIEGSKGFMKDLCAKAGVPTARYQRFTSKQAAFDYIDSEGAPIVVKTDGLAAGKGVTVARTVEEAKIAVIAAMQDAKFGAAGAELVIEEFMEGEEVSFFAICDGKTALPFTSAQDHKAVHDGDKGPNTGGMGAYSPAKILTPDLTDRVMRTIVQPTINQLAKDGSPYTGVLFAGLMLTQGGPKLIEFNARFGDPETQAMIPRLKTDLLTLLLAAATRKLDTVRIEWHDCAALCVVMAAKGYPDTYRKGTVIEGLHEAGLVPDTITFHAGTALNTKGEMTAVGGRVLGMTGIGTTIKEAQLNAYRAVAQVDWREGFCRSDIGWRAVKRGD